MSGWLRSLVGIGLCAVLVACGPTAPEPVASPSVLLPPTAEPPRAGTGSVRLELPVSAFTPRAPAGSTDEYRCFLLDPELDSKRFVTGVTFHAGNEDIVHHAILYRVAPGQVKDAKRLDAGDAQPGWECFGGSGLPGANNVGDGLGRSDWLAAWAPGGKPVRTPRGHGFPMRKGGRVVLQVHYNLRSSQGADDTSVDLNLAPAGRRLTPLYTGLLVAPVELPCTEAESGPLCDRDRAVADVVGKYGPNSGRTIAGLQLICGGDPAEPRAGDRQSCDRVVTEPATIFAIAGHMHLLGRSLSVELNPGQPGGRRLLRIGEWDFDDQAAIPMKKPVSVQPGDVLRLTCRHDARLRQDLPELRGLDPRYVVWGEGTADEMCLAVLVASDEQATRG